MIRAALALLAAAICLAQAVDLQDLLQRGLRAYGERNFATARALWEEGLREAEQQRDELFIGSFHGNLGVIDSVEGNYPQAIDHFEKSLAMAREAGDRQGLKNRLNNVAGLYLRLRLGQPDRALERLEEALPMARDMGDHRLECRILINTGEAQMAQKLNLEAAERLREAMAVASEHSLPELEVNAMSTLGVAYAAMGNYPAQAISHLRKSISTVRKAKDSQQKAATLIRDYNRLGMISLDIGDPRGAATLHQSALEEARALGSNREITASGRFLAKAVSTAKGTRRSMCGARRARKWSLARSCCSRKLTVG